MPHQLCQLSHATAHQHMQLCMSFTLVVHVHTELRSRYLQPAPGVWVLLTETR